MKENIKKFLKRKGSIVKRLKYDKIKLSVGIIFCVITFSFMGVCFKNEILANTKVTFNDINGVQKKSQSS